MNPFNLFNFDIETVSVGLVIALSLIVALGVYRPFCQFVCTFGFLSWLIEPISIFQVRIDRNRCINCGACVRACPLEAAKGRLEATLFSADCFSCARCLNVCPTDAIHYEFIGTKHRGMSASSEQANATPVNEAEGR